MRKFPSLRTGKYVSQGAHAAVGSLFSIGKFDEHQDHFIIPLYNPFVRSWVLGRFKKITTQVDTGEELVEIYNQAKAAGLPVALITDAGLTEFAGEPTLTSVGIGPGDPAVIDKITGHLKLF